MCFKISLNQMELIVVLDSCLFKIQSTPLKGAVFRDAPEPNLSLDSWLMVQFMFSICLQGLSSKLNF